MKRLAPLFLLLILLTGCVTLDPPKMTYLDAQVTKVTLEGTEVNFLFNAENTNPIPIEVTNYAYKVEINGRELLSESRPGFSLPANGKQRISIPVFVRYDRVLDSVLDVAVRILAGNMYLDYKVEGTLTVGTLGISATTPLKASGQVRIPKELFTF
jgi:LEA14-like dessication related protein